MGVRRARPWVFGLMESLGCGLVVTEVVVYMYLSRSLSRVEPLMVLMPGMAMSGERTSGKLMKGWLQEREEEKVEMRI